MAVDGLLLRHAAAAPADLARLLLEFQRELAVPNVPAAVVRRSAGAARLAGPAAGGPRRDVIDARGLRREFGRLVAVDDVSLTVPAGTILALLGPNGAGKTTTVRLLAGLLAPTAGEATVAGCDVRADPAGVRARVGLVTDTPGLHDQMTPLSYLDFFGRDLRAGRGQPDGGASTSCSACSICRPSGRRRMAGFSRGMQQKVALARALLHEPAVVFLDEPTTGLDPLGARAVRELIVGLKHASRSIVLCTHDLDEAERLADVGGDPAARARRGVRHRRGAAGSAVAATTLVRVALAAPCPAAVSHRGARRRRL